MSGPASAQAVDLTRGDCPVTVVGRSQGAWLTTNPPATQGLELITVAGGNLYKSEVSSTQASSIGSNGNDNNTWGTGSTAGATGVDLGSSWRLAVVTKVGQLLDQTVADRLAIPADLAQPLRLRVKLKVASTGSATRAGYAPRAMLHGVKPETTTGGWWAAADAATIAVSAGSSVVDGVFDAANNAWIFDFTVPSGFSSTNREDFVAVAITGNTNAIANEFITFSEAGSWLELTTDPGQTLAPDWLGDSDWDGMPDIWEADSGLDPADNGSVSPGQAPAADFDTDGVSNYASYRRNIHPGGRDTRSGLFTLERWDQAFPETDTAHTVRNARWFLPPDTCDYLETGRYFDIAALSAVRMRGRITAPATGEYRFWIGARAAAEILLSSDATPYRKRRIAVLGSTHGTGKGVGDNQGNIFDWYASQASEPITLQAGESYFVEVIGGTADVAHYRHISVAWAPPGQPREILPMGVVTPYHPLPGDADDDSLPDAWETAHGLSATDNGRSAPGREGEHGDFDCDGLENREEFLLGTDPANADTDSDGISDGEEVRNHHSDPLVSDAPAESIAASIPLPAFTTSTTDWKEVNGGLIADAFRSSITWNFTLTDPGLHIVHLATTLIGDVWPHEEMDILIKIDGHPAIRRTVSYGTEHKGLLRAITPHLAPGSHTITVTFDNYIGRRSARIDSLDIRKPVGTDANDDGIPDWIATILAQDDAAKPTPAGSPVSPVCIEGNARFPGQVTIGANPVTPGADATSWFHNLSLAADGSPTPFTVSYDTGLAENHSVEWQQTDVLAGGDFAIRTGDSLRLTAGDGSESFVLSLDGTAEGSFTGYLPTTAASAALAWPGLALAEISEPSGIIQGAAASTALTTATYFYQNDGTTATYQLQAFTGVHTKVVKIRLEQTTEGIKACQLYARYRSGNHLGADFDSNSSTMTMGAGGYGVPALTLRFQKSLAPAMEPRPVLFPWAGTTTVTAAGSSAAFTVRTRKANLPENISVAQNVRFDLTLKDCDTDRALDFSGGSGLVVEPPKSIDSASYKLGLLPAWGGEYGLVARLWNEGPIVDIVGISAIGISDALQNELQTVSPATDFPGYHLLKTPMVVTNLPPGGYVKVVIFRAGVTFTDGTTVKTFTSAQLASGMLMLEFLVPEDMAGGFCHYIDVYGANGEYVGRR